jgi:hypothetical protein
VLRALEPVKKVAVRLHAEGTGGEVRVRVGDADTGTTVSPEATLELEPGEGYQYYDTFLYRVVFDSHAPGRVFVRIDLEVNRRPG